MIAFGRPEQSLLEMARQAAAAITLADRYTDAFAQAQRRKQPTAAAEIQQSLLPPRIMRITGGEVAGNVLPSYEVAGDWFDVIENAEGIWITVADGLGGSTRAAASSAVALGALRASRRSGADIMEALVVMHQTLREMPGPRAEMTAVAARWDPGTAEVRIANCGHVAPVILRADGDVEHLRFAKGRGLGGRASPRPIERIWSLASGDRLLMVSDGVVKAGEGQAGLGVDGLIEAALRSERQTAADTVRKVHTAVLDASGGELGDDATVVCLSCWLKRAPSRGDRRRGAGLPSRRVSRCRRAGIPMCPPTKEITMPEMTDARELFLHELGDILYAENMLVKTLPKMAEEATDDELRTGFTEHLEQTRAQVDRIKKSFASLGEKASAEQCPGIEGIIEEHDEFMKENDPSAEICDLFLTGAGARTEHYEIAAYSASS